MKKFIFIMPLMAVSLLASCDNSSVKKYIIYFDTNGGSPEVERQIVKENDYATDPQIDVKRNGIPMSYWSLQDEEEFNPSEFTFKDNKITSDITLHAIYPADTTSPLTITCTKGSMNLSLYWFGDLTTDSDLNIKWSKDKSKWETFSTTLTGKQSDFTKIQGSDIQLNTNDTIYLVGANPDGFSFSNSKGKRVIKISNDLDDKSSEFIVSGSPLSLINETDFSKIFKIPSDYCFNYLFQESNVTSAKKMDLSCDKLSCACYASMFSGCSKLSEAPNLPSINLADFCYASMFMNCDNLIDVPAILPATELKNECYHTMFTDCGILENAPELPAYAFDDNCKDCYYKMFGGCGALSHIKVGFGKDNVWPGLSNNDYTEDWMTFVSDSGTFEWKGTNSPTFECSEDTIPENWTIKPYKSI